MPTNPGTIKVPFSKNIKLHCILALLATIWAPIAFSLIEWPAIAFGVFCTSAVFLCISIFKWMKKAGYAIAWLE